MLQVGRTNAHSYVRTGVAQLAVGSGFPGDSLAIPVLLPSVLKDLFDLRSPIALPPYHPEFVGIRLHVPCFVAHDTK
jgi:hypothetical protein